MRVLILITLFFSASAFAQKLKVREINPADNLVSVHLGDVQVREGMAVLFSKNGKTCTLTITQVTNKKAIADGKECEIMDEIESGDTLVVSELQNTGDWMAGTPTSNPEHSREKTTWENGDSMTGFQVALSFNLANELKNEANNGSTTNYNGSNSFSIGARYSEVPTFGFGFNVGFHYEFEREFDTYTNFVGTTELNPKAKLGFIAPEINGVYRREKTYGFIGINVPMMTSDDNFFASVNGEMGIQTGIGLMAANHIGVEAYYRTLNFSTAGTDSSRLWGFGLRAVYNF